MNSHSTIPLHKSKGRPRTFDRAVALESALKVFWLHGFEPASVSELCAAIGTNPPSLYAAFGNKAQLFMEAVDYYERLYWDDIWSRMAARDDLREALVGFFREAARVLTLSEAPCGCLVVLAATNVSPESQGVNDALRKLRQESMDRFLQRLRRAVDEGQLSTEADVKGLALTLNALLQGMSLQARDGATQEDLEQIGIAAAAILGPSSKRG